MRKHGLYDMLETWGDLDAFKRRRKVQVVAVSDELVAQSELICAGCKKPIVAGNLDQPEGYRATYADYWPRSKRLQVTHYICGWQILFEEIYSYHWNGRALVKG